MYESNHQVYPDTSLRASFLMSDLWFTSDTHFGHANVISYSNRPFVSAEDMDERMIAAWNDVVKHEDEVWHLGDFSFHPFKQLVEVLRRLHGKKHLILGNHDKTIVKNKSKLTLPGSGDLFHSIQHYAELKPQKDVHLVLFHYGQRVWNKHHHGSIHLYGHSHGSLPPHGLSVDVGVDCKEITDEYRPVSLDEVLAYMEKRQKSIVDHHTGERD